MPERDKSPKAEKIYDFEEELQYWKTAYLDLVKESGKKMNPPPSVPPVNEQKKNPAPSERRDEPRYSFDDISKIYAHLGPRAFRILNISVGGLAFYSDMFFSPGTKLLMSALGMIALDVEVLSCEIEETNSDLMEYKYRVRAKFGPRVNGYQVYVLAREMYLQEGGKQPEQVQDHLGIRPGPGAPPKQ